jgi:hypothetical protein
MVSNGSSLIGNIVKNNMSKDLLINTIIFILRGFDKFENLSDVS